MRHPRVLALTHSLSGVDGVGRYGVSTLRYLAPLCGGVEVFIGRRHRGFAEDMRWQGLTVHEILPADHFPFLGVPKLGWLLALRLPELVRAARRSHLVHSLSDYPMGFVATLAGRLAKRPVVVSGHGTYSVTPLEMAVHGRLIRWMYAHADRFVMGAGFAMRRLLASVEPAAPEVVPYGCVPADYEARAAAGAEPGVPDPFVLSIGEVKQRKGYETSLPAFLEAWSRRPELHYAVVGRHDDRDPYVERLRARVEAAGATGHVHLLGNVEEARKVALLRAARAFVLTPMTSVEGSFEAFGLVFLEAGAAGRPVVGVTDSGAEDAITDGENGYLLAREDVAGIAGALVRLVDDPALADRLGAAGRARAERQTWERAARRVRTIYGDLLGGDFVLPDGEPPAGPGPGWSAR